MEFKDLNNINYDKNKQLIIKNIKKLISSLKKLLNCLEVDINERKLSPRDVAEIYSSADSIAKMIQEFINGTYELDQRLGIEILSEVNQCMDSIRKYVYDLFHNNPEKIKEYILALEEIRNNSNEDRQYEDYRRYKEEKITELQNKYFSRKTNLIPKDGYITIIFEKKKGFGHIQIKFEQNKGLYAAYQDNMDKVYAIIFGNEITRIPSGFCSGICNLEDCILPENLEEIGEYAFAHTKLSEICMPPNVKKILERAFECVANLETLLLNNGLTYIGPMSFSIESQRSKGLKKLVIPKSVDKIDTAAFSGQSELAEIFFEGTREIGESAFAFTNPRVLEFPDSLENVGGFAFYQIPRLEEIIFNDGIENIGSYSFALNQHTIHSSLKSVEIPKTMQEIGYKAFANQILLESVHFENSNTKIGDDAFSGTPYERLSQGTSNPGGDTRNLNESREEGQYEGDEH